MTVTHKSGPTIHTYAFAADIDSAYILAFIVLPDVVIHMFLIIDSITYHIYIGIHIYSNTDRHTL